MSDALIDNSGFAGLMRCYRPEMPTHRAFIERFPDHLDVDRVSVAQFLTALVIYDELCLDASSSSHEDSQVDVIPDKKHRIIRDFCGSWVRDLVKELPSPVQNTISEISDLKKETTKRNHRARRLAFELFASPLCERLRLRPGEKLPDVYTDESYVDRPMFERMNSERGNVLAGDLLAQAMFLHRGLYLQACSGDCTYVPYLYRGRMLESIPPSLSAQISESKESGDPLAQSVMPMEVAASKELSRFYYGLLEKLTWTTYNEAIPFIGSAILAKTGFDLDRAFRLAMELRQEGKLRKLFDDLDDSRRSGDRVMYEIFLQEIKNDLSAAARHMGLNEDNPHLKTLWDLLTFWLPDGVQKAIEASIGLLPIGLRNAASQIASTLLRTQPHQMLLIDHTRAIQAVRLASRN